jgi:glycosyltransferase involved in cell wall biosynthesis
VDDGSPDRCPEMCDQWAKKDGRIRVIHKENGGLSSARNAGLDVATGDYIGFIDSDDFIKKDMYEKLLAAFAEAVDIGITSCFMLKYDNNNSTPFIKQWHIEMPRIIKYDDFGQLLLTEKVNFTLCSKLFKREIVDKARFDIGIINEDIPYVFKLSLIVKELKLNMLEIPYYGYYYRMRDDSICHDKSRPLIQAIIRNFQEIELKSSESAPDLAEALKYHWHAYLLNYYGNLLSSSNDNLLIRKYRNEVKRISIIDLWKNEEFSAYQSLVSSVMRIDGNIYKVVKNFCRLIKNGK